MTQQILEGKIGLVFGVANKRSIAWAIAKAWAAAGARLIFNYQGERLKENVEELVAEFAKIVSTALQKVDVRKRLAALPKRWAEPSSSKSVRQKGCSGIRKLIDSNCS